MENVMRRLFAGVLSLGTVLIASTASGQHPLDKYVGRGACARVSGADRRRGSRAFVLRGN
jgi:hypothetical protein